MKENDSTEGMLLKMSPVHDVIDPDRKFPGIKELFKKILSLLILKKTIQSWAQRQLLKTKSLHLEAECHRLKNDCEELEKEEDDHIKEGLKKAKDDIIRILTEVHDDRVSAAESIEALVSTRKENMSSLKQFATEQFEAMSQKHHFQLSEDLQKLVLECAQSLDINTCIQEMIERSISLPNQVPAVAQGKQDNQGGTSDGQGDGEDAPSMEGFFSALFWLAYHLGQGVLSGQGEQVVIPDDVKAMDIHWVEKQQALVKGSEMSSSHSEEELKQFEEAIDAIEHRIEDLRWKHTHSRSKST